MGRKPSLHIDVAKVNPTPLAPPSPSRKPAGREHTRYVDLMTQLRNPITAAPLEFWMQTGKTMGRQITASSPRQKLAKARRREPEVTAEEYGRFFEQDASGSLSGSMSGYMSEADKMVEKVLGNDEFKALKETRFKAAPEPEEPTTYNKVLIERFPYPGDVAKKKPSSEGYEALFDDPEKKEK